jgi:hypothetical protein
VEARDVQLAALRRQLAEAHAELAQRSSAPHPVQEDGRAEELEVQNAELAAEVEQLRAQVVAAAAAAAAAPAPAAQAATGEETAELLQQLTVAKVRCAELEAELAAARSAPTAQRSSSSGGEEAAAKLALAEAKVQQLVELVQQQGAGADRCA